MDLTPDDFDMELGQEEVIDHVKQAMDQIQLATTKEANEYHLFTLLAFLIASSEEISKQGDFYEAAGRLYSAAYYLEEFYPKEAINIYEKAADYYHQYLSLKLREGAANEAANVAIRIANIYRDKLTNQEKEQVFVNKAIDLLKTQI